MSLWLDLLGCEIRYVDTPEFGRTRIAEAGDRNLPTLIFLHGIGGHLEAYAKNILPLADRFHVVAYDYPGHGLSEKVDMTYTPMVLGEHLKALMATLQLDSAHLSGESLGGWVAGHFAVNYPERVKRLMLNTSGGLPVLTDKGRADLLELKTLSQKAAEQGVTHESVHNRMKWLFHPDNYDLITDEVIRTRLAIYLDPDFQAVAPQVNEMIARHDDYLTPLEAIRTQTLFLWTEDNPVHDLETARLSYTRVPDARLYVMRGKSAHWPQWEGPEEFNSVCREFFADGSCSGAEARPG